MYGYLPMFGSYGRGKLTQTAGTAIVALIPPKAGAITHLMSLVITEAGTANAIYLMRPLNYTTANGAAASGQKVVNLTADPGIYSTNYQYPLLNQSGNAPSTLPTFQTADNGVAASDYLVFETPDGAFYFDAIGSVSTLAVTMTNNLPAGGIADGAKIWHMGVDTDTDPATGIAQPALDGIASATTNYTDPSDSPAGLVQTLHPYDPLLIYCPNATAACTLERLAALYAKF